MDQVSQGIRRREKEEGKSNVQSQNRLSEKKSDRTKVGMPLRVEPGSLSVLLLGSSLVLHVSEV